MQTEQNNTKQAYLLNILGAAMPFVGAGFNAVSAANRVGSGDLLGAGIDSTAALSDLTGAGWPISLALNGVNILRDMSRPEKKPKHDFNFSPEEPEEHQERWKNINHNSTQHNHMNNMLAPVEAYQKQAATNFEADLANPMSGYDTDLYRAVTPLISSEDSTGMSPADRSRRNALREEVRKGIVGLNYLTGLKKNVGETFYDEHPTEAVLTDLTSKALPIGGIVGTGALAEHVRRQHANFKKTEPAKMSRTENPLDTTNPANLLDPGTETSKGTRSDISRIFGDLGEDNESRARRLGLLDTLNNRTGEPESFLSRHEKITTDKSVFNAAHEAKLKELTSTLEGAAASKADKAEIERIKTLISAHKDTHAQELSKIDAAMKQLLSEAKHSESAGGLHKYVNLHESLRRAREAGGLKDYIGQGMGSLGGVEDLLEKYHITGAHPHFNEDLIKSIAREYGGSHASGTQWENFLNNTIRRISDPSHQSSGLRKAFTRLKAPAGIAAATAAGGTGLHYLLKAMQNQNYSPEQIRNWKKTLLKAQGDFEATDQLD